MPFAVHKADLDRYASALDREVALDLRGALGWLGADEDDPTLEASRHDSARSGVVASRRPKRNSRHDEEFDG